ncbi:hypothetical protein QVD17_22291 [Tagetes erecta]|uniref:Uncharacterized protein n=1 Tax=Tagetes erecta TaxID=13708 RepID=A0AAD8KJ87_TARER|nr:hypothetical protein QVD17_22291 [Tagetes erecta]
MDPNTVVLEISSDDETVWDDHIGTDGTDDYNWIADILDEVNRDDCGYDDEGDDSDEVVLVTEILPKKPRKKNKFTSKSPSLIQFDDDCMLLDHDPDKPPRNDKLIDRDELHDDDDDDDDDIVVVSEKGQVACRDYPHPRHLCIKFPFTSSPNQSHCDQCYCYVCDSLAPCIYWGNGNGSIDHCLATDKSQFWILERQNSKNAGKEVNVPPVNPVPQTTTIAHNPTMMPNSIRACPVTSSFGVPNVINQDRSSFLLSRNNNYQPGLVSQQLTRTNSCTIPGGRVHHSYNLDTSVHRPVFKRTASDGFASTTNRHSYSPYYRHHFTGAAQPNLNSSAPFTPRSNTPFEAFDFPTNFQPLANSDPYVEVPVLFKPNPVSLSSQAQGKSSVPSYTIPSEPSRQESQRSTIDPKFFSGISWPQSQINHPPPAARSSLLEGVSSTNEPPLATGSGGLVDFEYDNWMFNNQPCEGGSMDGSGPFGLSELSSDSGRGYNNSGTIFDF